MKAASLIWQKVFFYNSRGNKLAGLLAHPPESRRKIAVVCHGFTGSKEGGGRALEMAGEIGRQGWSTFLFDFAGCGESEGLFEDLTLTGQVDDLSCALDWCKQKGFSKIVTLGRSFGGTTAICQAARDLTAAGVCTWAAPARPAELFTNLSDEEGERIVLAGEKGVVYLKKGFLADLRRYDVAGDAARLSPRPILIVHGTEDELVSPAEANIIYRSAGEPKQLTWIDGGDHQFTRHYRQVWQAVREWLATFQ
ncbi:MAG: alpha/beta hydrolase [Bacillota bacterium]